MNQKTPITNQEQLREAIAELELRRTAQSAEVHTEFWTVYENLKPVNLIKNTLKEAVRSPEITGGVVHAALGMATGMITRKLFVGSSSNPVRNVLGTLLMFGVRRMISQNQPLMNAIGNGIRNLTSPKESEHHLKEK